ncbi:MAG: hypothetical protein IT198_10220 [Acidimicrobiia bacterium]|nr:hypothetical protein [Acidimicrobiia bacterium]
MRGFGWGHRVAAGLLCALIVTACSGSRPPTPRTDVRTGVRAETPFRRWDVVRRAIAGLGGVVAVGTGDDGAVAWVSSSGGRWERFLIEAGRAHADTLATDGTTYVATGLTADTARVWTSVDGRAWKSLPAPPLPAGTGFTGSAIRDGSILVVGERPVGDAQTVPFAWRLAGGVWEEQLLPLLPGAESLGVVNDVIAAQDTFVAVGAVLGLDLPVCGAVWTWTGHGWERSRTIEDPGGSDFELLAVQVGTGGLTASAGVYDNWDEPGAGGESVIVGDLLGEVRVESVEAEPGAEIRPYVAAGVEWLLVKEGRAGRSRVLSRSAPGSVRSWTEIGMPGLATELVVSGGSALAFVVDTSGVTQVVPL